MADADSDSGFRIVHSGTSHIFEDLTWHPDGKRVAFATVMPPANKGRLVIVHRESENIPDLLPGQPADWNISGIDWSPDGKQIVFAASEPPSLLEWPLAEGTND